MKFKKKPRGNHPEGENTINPNRFCSRQGPPQRETKNDQKMVRGRKHDKNHVIQDEQQKVKLLLLY